MNIQILASVCFFAAILHTFSVGFFHKLGNRFAAGSVGENVFHLLGEVEVVFGIWAAIFCSYIFFDRGGLLALNQYLEGKNFTEPVFVFVIMTICSSNPILFFVEALIAGVARLLPLPGATGLYIAALVVGPLLGSVVTEPAAMTVTAMFLLKRFLLEPRSEKFLYSTIGLLFVNVSIGGTLTPFAAPPVLMVAKTWNWDLSFMLFHFGWKAVLAVLISTTFVTIINWNELQQMGRQIQAPERSKLPKWVTGVHLLLLAAVVASSHHMIIFIAIFLFFLGIFQVTQEYQRALKLKESLLVGFFLAGLVVLGGEQSWWLQPLLQRLDSFSLYVGATLLTAITDNAALTFLGAQIPNLAEAARLSLVAGAVVGGGLTVIANAPNPAGYAILFPAFGANGISPLKLLLGSLVPTLVAFGCFLL